jgi:hypothetical protein
MKWNHNLSTHFLNHNLSNEDRDNGKSQYAVLAQPLSSLNTSVYRPGYAVFGGHFMPRVTTSFEKAEVMKRPGGC